MLYQTYLLIVPTTSLLNTKNILILIPSSVVDPNPTDAASTTAILETKTSCKHHKPLAEHESTTEGLARASSGRAAGSGALAQLSYWKILSSWLVHIHRSDFQDLFLGYQLHCLRSKTRRHWTDPDAAKVLEYDLRNITTHFVDMCKWNWNSTLCDNHLKIFKAAIKP